MFVQYYYALKYQLQSAVWKDEKNKNKNTLKGQKIDGLAQCLEMCNLIAVY